MLVILCGRSTIQLTRCTEPVVLRDVLLVISFLGVGLGLNELICCVVEELELEGFAWQRYLR